MNLSNLQKGQTLDSGFTILDIVDLGELRAAGIWARHTKSGAEVFHVLNDDNENLFAFAFATIPENDTGAAHILEHSVLCGSEYYPLKDAFLILAQGSLQTFLNAWTFPDKTVYPASSVNEHDYFNLMSVYGDAVFRPLLSEWTFMQEGYRYEYSKNDASLSEKKLSITGVVYNEMKGAYSSLETYASHWSVKAVLPDTPYGFESGGDPEHIPELSHEGLKEFHRKRYSPANCRIFLAGNISTEKQLAYLNEHFFTSLEGGMASAPVIKQKRWSEPKELRIPCPAGGDTRPTAFLSWLCFDGAPNSGVYCAESINENLALCALTEILLGHDGSPLTRALIESGLGEDITPVSGIEHEIGETLFVAGLRGMKDAPDECGKKLEALIMGELKRLVIEGIPKGEIEAALSFMEFSQREVKRSGGPFSLVWMRRCLRGWLHGSKPWENLLLLPAMDEIKRRLGEKNRYFESLIQRHFLDNPHRALVLIEPEEDYLPRQEANLLEILAKKEDSLGSAEKESIVRKAAALEKIQSEDDSPEALAAIPHLSRSDLSANPEIIHRSIEDLRGIPALCHDLYTNGISYMDLAFPLDLLPSEDYSWLPFYARAAISVGLPGMDYGEVSSLLARTTGGLITVLHTGSAVPAAGTQLVSTPSCLQDITGRDWIIYRLKCLDEKATLASDIVLRLLCEADFSDTRRLRDLVLEMKNEMRSSLAPGGHNFASCRAGRFSSASSFTSEIWNGITQLEFAHHLAELDINEIAVKLQNLRDAINSGGLIANIAGSAEALKNNRAILAESFNRFGPPKSKNKEYINHMVTQSINKNSASSLCETLRHSKNGNPLSNNPEVFGSPSLQIGFAAMSLRAAPFDTAQQVAETVLSHMLSTGALWEDIRMKGGAYGAFASGDSLERCFSLATYRDPAPLRSLEAFLSILKSKPENFTTEDDLVKTIIGCYARETRPRSPWDKSMVDFLRFISYIDDDHRKRKLERLISVSPGDICSALGGLASQLETNDITGKVVITGMKDAEKAAKAMGTEIQVLPV